MATGANTEPKAFCGPPILQWPVAVARSAPPVPQNLKPLTSLRFFAALWVVVYHYWPNLQASRPTFVDKGVLGVELFFVLSGFILSHIYLEKVRDGRFDYGAFLWARLARIYPLHIAIITGLIALLLCLALAGIHAGDQVLIWPSLPAQLTLTQAWGLGTRGGWNYPAWSISAEWFAYLAFPAFALAACRLWHRPRLAIGLAAALVVLAYSLFPAAAGFPLVHASIQWGALRIVPSFALGCAIWLIWNADLITSKATALALAGLSVAALLAAVALGLPDSISVMACAGLVLGLGAAARHGSRVLSHPILVHLGEISFALYMISIPWQLVFTTGLQKMHWIDPSHMPPRLWLLMVAGTVPMGLLCHHLIERPARERMRRMRLGKPAPRLRLGTAE